MTRIDIYNIEANKIDELEEKTDATPAAIIEALFEAIEDNDIDIEDYL